MRTTALFSLGRMAAMLQTPVHEVRAIIDRIGGCPMFRLDGVPYFTIEVFQAVIARAKNDTTDPAYNRTFFEEVRS